MHDATATHPGGQGARGAGRDPDHAADLADDYAAALLRSLGWESQPSRDVLSPAAADLCAARDWAASGLMWLTGEGAPARCGHAAPTCASGALRALRSLCGARNALPDDGAALLGERAALLGLRGRGRVSPNGSCVLFETADGHLALNLAREADRALLPAWLETPAGALETGSLARLLRTRGTRELLARGRLLGLPLASPGEEAGSPPWFRVCREGPYAPPRPAGASPLVVDLSSLWAGPLCAALLGAAGARVVKVESAARPDGARGGAREFYDLLNAGKQSVSLDFAAAAGRAQLARLLSAADIVIEGSRPRALQQLGIDAGALVASGRGKIWIGLSGHGRAPPGAHWTAFGDDAAVAAGLHYTAPGGGPAFCGDALCDPLAGIHAALAAQAFWRSGRGALLDVNLREVGAHCRGFYTSVQPGRVEAEPGGWRLRLDGHGVAIHPPRPRRARGRAAESGADNAAVLAEFAA